MKIVPAEHKPAMVVREAATAPGAPAAESVADVAQGEAGAAEVRDAVSVSRPAQSARPVPRHEQVAVPEPAPAAVPGAKAPEAAPPPRPPTRPAVHGDTPVQILMEAPPTLTALALLGEGPESIPAPAPRDTAALPSLDGDLRARTVAWFDVVDRHLAQWNLQGDGATDRARLEGVVNDPAASAEEKQAAATLRLMTLASGQSEVTSLDLAAMRADLTCDTAQVLGEGGGAHEAAEGKELPKTVMFTELTGKLYAIVALMRRLIVNPAYAHLTQATETMEHMASLLTAALRGDAVEASGRIVALGREALAVLAESMPETAGNWLRVSSKLLPGLGAVPALIFAYFHARDARRAHERGETTKELLHGFASLTNGFIVSIQLAEALEIGATAATGGAAAPITVPTVGALEIIATVVALTSEAVLAGMEICEHHPEQGGGEGEEPGHHDAVPSPAP